ncbi:MAG: nicotinate-nucleotide--dimethylbenzimidazole phosphoribosyltransferase [Gammaproteobacteria bacterium]|nr:nicotinate-nucleotide--dimethylbenzimidazole phosphoribosyltransferase [Gammaproteobacteria bacterium]MBU1647683.1 nicotinate-nucleotide--dimethylbenzimidazole phosphoribosyltransferase [Gammaproteobacteria bacterium]MBU1971829.1 nicotinate-nucleotide--dimethylbenzimidazole phosphoribosyltransferase [Gammaproteobacteria bacterium]
MDKHIEALGHDTEAALRQKIDGKTKPPGSLGRLEELALQIGLIQGTLSPAVKAPHILVCAGDHGAAKAGVSAYPQDVTWQMVENFLAGGAAINALARQAGVELVVADAGVAHDFGPRPNLIAKKVGAGGTASYLDGAAMTAAQCAQAMANGADVVRDIASRGCNAIGFGEMGIGNTASASLLTHCFTGAPLVDVVGRGTGLDDAGLARKRALLEEALTRHPDPQSLSSGRSGDQLVLNVLAHYGGFEIAMLAGAMLEAGRQRMVLVIDGFIVTAALLAATRLAPQLLDYCVFAHRSGEPGHAVQLDHLGARPLLDLGMRLGEGTGAALAFPLLAAACAFMNEMASFESAGVSAKS